MPMKKLLQINVCSNLSTGRIAEDIASVAKQDGWDCYLAYGRGTEPKENKGLRIGSQFDLYEHVLESRLLDWHGRGSRRATKAFLKQVEQLQPDVIHLHNIDGYYLNLQQLFDFLGRKQIPVVWTVHSCWPFTGHCAHFAPAHCEKWKTQCHDCPLVQTYPKSWWADRSRKNYAEKKRLFNQPAQMLLTPVSKWLCGLLKESFLQKYPTEVIYNGVDLNTFSPKPQSETAALRQRYSLQDQFVLLGVASTWTEQKGLSHYVELSKRLPAGMRMVLIGLNDKQIEAMPANVLGLRRTSSIDELVAFYSAADVVLNLSEAETFGLTTAEGMACGTPSVVFNTTASPELITPATGAVAPMGDLAAVMQAVEQIRANGKAAYSTACRQRAVEHFDKTKNFQRYVEIYNELRTPLPSADKNTTPTANGQGN